MNQNDIAAVTALIESRFPQLAKELGRTDLELLLAAASLLDVPPGRALLRDRMPADHLYFVLSGKLRVSIEDAGKSQTLSQVNPGEWVGELAVLSGDLTASASVVAETPCQVVKLHRQSFAKLIADHDVIARVLLEQFIDLMAKRLRDPLAATPH
jgi:CRP-like cAMP-binding protein